MNQSLLIINRALYIQFVKHSQTLVTQVFCGRLTQSHAHEDMICVH